MSLHTESISCLVVEDDTFKSESICAHIGGLYGEAVTIVTCQALSTARAALAEQRFDIAIIDMSIPSHPALVGAGSPYSFPTGGLDVLFEIEHLNQQSCCIILTQYPEIEIEGTLIPVDIAAQEILEKFDINVAGCIQYHENDSQWKTAVSNILRSI